MSYFLRIQLFCIKMFDIQMSANSGYWIHTLTPHTNVQLLAVFSHQLSIHVSGNLSLLAWTISIATVKTWSLWQKWGNTCCVFFTCFPLCIMTHGPTENKTKLWYTQTFTSGGSNNSAELGWPTNQHGLSFSSIKCQGQKAPNLSWVMIRGGCFCESKYPLLFDRLLVLSGLWHVQPWSNLQLH